MPPKGWRKNAEGQYPQPNKDNAELVSIDEILFPRSTIQKLAKSIIAEDNMILAKDSVLALQRSATVFVSHLMFHARKTAKAQGRKTVSSLDMLNVIEHNIEFAGFIPEIKSRLSNYEEMLNSKKQQRLDKVSEQEGPSASKKIRLDEGVTEVPEEQEEGEEQDEVEEVEDEEVEEIEEIEDVDEDEEEEETSNPIEILSKQESELQGDSHDSTDEVEDEEEHSDVD
ncbi:DNA polymerase epsilon subunit D [Spathaspora sp. JA1]|nr:DNA polymerase epsilon subunit D [Spathaspora sp. JA1]